MTSGIEEFWQWWSGARDRVASAIEARTFGDELVEEVSKYVAAVGTLDWEFGPGQAAKHTLCLSGAGDPELRIIAEMWRQSAPAGDDTWQYVAARQGGRTLPIVFEDVTVALDDLVVTFEVDHGRERIDGSYFHPRFAEIPDDKAGLVLELLLAGALGEDDVVRWIGTVDVAESRPADAVAFPQLAAAVRELQRTATGEQFAVLSGETGDGRPLFVTCNQALKRIDHLMHTEHLAIDLAILDQNEQGLTTAADADQLHALEDELHAELRGLAVFVGRETIPGHRIAHWYVPTESAAQGIVDRWAARHAERRLQIEWIHDPRWEFAQRYI